MNVSHHLSDETLQDYVAGSLSMPMETLVACHLTACPICRKQVRLAESLAGRFLHNAEPTECHGTAADLLERAAATSGQASTDPAVIAGVRVGVPGVPRPLGRLLPAPLEELRWSRLAPGIKQHNLSTQHRRYGAFKLLHLDPGVVLSQHTHTDRELTFVVRGSYVDEIGRFRAGDIADLDGRDIHQPVVDTDEPCIALIASQSPVRYSGMLGRIMQPFVGI